MDRLSGLDASFLYLETPAQLMHVCGLIVLDPSTMPEPYTFASLRDGIDARVRDVPEFTRKLRRVPLGLDHPVWVRDTQFDIERHVHRLALPTPGGYAELTELAGHLAGLPLDRSRPLWEMWVIEGLKNLHSHADGTEQVAVFQKMHHATVDGVSGASLISHLCSLEPDAEPIGASQEKKKWPHEPGRAELLGRAMVSSTTRPFTTFGLLAPTVKGVVGTIGRAREGTAMAAPLTAPRTSFNGTITGHRSIAFSVMDLDTIKEVKSATGTTVNDVVLAVAGGALRSYLEDRDELPESSLLATVPVSVRSESKRPGANKVSALFTRLGTDVEDPLERLEDMATSNRNAKDHHKAISADALQDWAEFAAPRTFGLAVRAYAGLRLAEKHPVVHNLVISNVPGPPLPLYFMGARIEALHPLGPVFHGAGLNITVMSNNGRVGVGVIACRESMPDVDDLAQRFPAELERLREAVQASGATTPITKAKGRAMGKAKA
jgi:diacylglycerol O-acyltransferase / wax synthase